ncbi:MAG: hypothetical protein E7638_07900 [Ruminococcaceae bacterium]|nr:hypothetical protein [Oscillospiraceae bacterium]
MKSKKIIDIAYSLSFLLFLGAVLLFAFIREPETYSYYENRNLAVMPGMTAHGMLDGGDFSAVETYLSDHAPGRNTALKARTWIDLRLLRRPVVNDTVVMREENLLLPYNAPDYEAKTLNGEVVEREAEEIAARLARHAEAVNSYGGYFCYIAVPCQYVCHADAYPSWLNNRSDFTELTSRALFSRLDGAGVPYIDMRAACEKNGTLRENSSAVDNHYSIYGAFEVYEALMEKLDEETDLGLPTPEKDDFVFRMIENPYLGSRTRKLCGLWESEEHLWRADPVSPVPLVRSIKGEVVSDTVYALPYNDWQEVLYTAYMGGDLSEARVDTDREALPDILIYGDSFTNALECVLWYSFDTMYTYDFRHYTARTLDEIIEEVQPDVVVCVRDYQQLLLETGNGQ